ncbi:MAG: hypothetical protein IPH28_15865 [Cytophagaceae bacterium]|nr:hypothetical protein [Cytophagaceae bacterium]
MLGVTTSVIQDKRIQKKDGTFSVKLRITFNREQKYYPVNVSLTEEDWDKTQSFKARGELKNTKVSLIRLSKKPLILLKVLTHLVFRHLIKHLIKKTDRSKDVFYYLENYMEQLKNESRSGTENSYKCAYNSFKII